MEPLHAQTEAVLDYASPRKFSKMRLPAQSVITFDSRNASHVRIHEQLKGREQALGAILFGLAMLALLSAVGYAQLQYAWKRGYPEFYTLDLPLVGLPWAGLVLTMIAVVRQTWRSTVLEVDADVVVLVFKTLFSRRTYRWSKSELTISFTESYVPLVGPVLGELRILADGGPLFRLFIDHDMGEVRRLHDLMHLAMGGTVSGEQVQGITRLILENDPSHPAPPPAEVDPQNISYLAQRRAEWRKRL